MGNRWVEESDRQEKVREIRNEQVVGNRWVEGSSGQEKKVRDVRSGRDR